MNCNFEYTSYLQYKIKALSNRIDEFESGEKYIKMQDNFNKLLSARDREIARLKSELICSHQETANARKHWF
jgi:hypothetical protein